MNIKDKIDELFKSERNSRNDDGSTELLVHDLPALKLALMALLDAFADELIGKDEDRHAADIVAVMAIFDGRNQLREQQRARKDRILGKT